MDREAVHETTFGKIRCLFTGKRFKDSSYSWVVCISSAVCNAITIGFALSFGVLFPELIKYFDETRERTAFVGSATLGMLWFASPLPGYIYDRFGGRISTFLGALLCMTGLLSSSYVQTLTQMYFAYSLVIGLGASFIQTSCYLVIADHFEGKLSIATGIVAMGASVGVLYTGPLLQLLLDSFGWRGALRIMTAFFSFVCILSLAFNPNVEKKTSVVEAVLNGGNEENEKRGISFNCSVWTFPTYAACAISFTFASFGMYVPYINLVKFSEDIGITAQKASLLFTFIGIDSAIAQVVSGRLCNEKSVNPVYINQASTLLACVSAFLLPFSTRYWHLIVFSVAYGLSEGFFSATQNFILLSCVDNRRKTASFCINNVLYSFAAAAGGPIAGLLADNTGNYVYSFYMTGGTLLVAFVIPMILIVIKCKTSRVHPQNVEEADKREPPKEPQA